MKDETYRIMGTSIEVELPTYVAKVLNEQPGTTLHVGTDSQNYAGKTVYVSTIVFRFPGKGAHVIYTKQKVKRIRDMWTRLWSETERSIAIANYLRDELKVPVEQVDLDYNESPEYPSNKVLKVAKGFVESLGFNAKAKPDILLACWAANALCH